MENNLIKISQRIHNLVHELSPLLGENVEMEIIYAIADELLSDMDISFIEAQQYNELKKALVNMFICGQLFSNKK